MYTSSFLQPLPPSIPPVKFPTAKSLENAYVYNGFVWLRGHATTDTNIRFRSRFETSGKFHREIPPLTPRSEATVCAVTGGILANQPTAWLHKLHDARSVEIAAAGLGDDWPAFRRKLSEIRRNGFYVSRGELEADLSAVAAPTALARPKAQSALALVTSSERFELLNVDVLSRLVVNGAGEIGAILTATWQTFVSCPTSNEYLANGCFAPIVLKKSSLSVDRKFSGPLVRLIRCDVRGQTTSPGSSGPASPASRS